MEDDSHLIDSRIYVHIYYIDISYILNITAKKI